MIRAAVVVVVAVIACNKSSTERAADPPRPEPTKPEPTKPEVAKPDAEAATPKPAPPKRPADSHRGASGPCERDAMAAPPNPEYQGCKSNKECGKGERCTVAHRIGNSVFANACVKDACFADSDCGKGPGGVCACAPYGNYCIGGNCRTDGDCGAGGACSPSYGCRGGMAGYFCHTAADACVNDQDCNSAQCRFSAEVGHWACVRLACPVG